VVSRSPPETPKRPDKIKLSPVMGAGDHDFNGKVKKGSSCRLAYTAQGNLPAVRSKKMSKISNHKVPVRGAWTGERVTVESEALNGKRTENTRDGISWGCL